MARPKGSTIGFNPLDAVVPMRQAEPASPVKEVKHEIPVKREKVTVSLPSDLMEKLRAAAYWSRLPLAALVEEGIHSALANAEKENGGPFQPITERLRPGRKVGG